jgi:hypothetical protein
MIDDLERRRDPEAVKADRERRRKVLGDARNFLLHFGSLVRQLLVHDPTNQAVLGVLGQVERDFENLRAVDGMLTTVFAEGHTFSNGVWVRPGVGDGGLSHHDPQEPERARLRAR